MRHSRLTFAKAIRCTLGHGLAAATLFHCASACAGTLSTGPEMADCASALRPGPSACPPEAGEADARRYAHARVPGNAPEPELEARVDAFLAAYGKPPREAVRALLEPSDDHVREMLRERQQTLAVAAYVAARMSALQGARGEAPAPADPALPGRAPDFHQMRVTLLTRAADPDAAPALQALRSLALARPALRAQVGLVGPTQAAALGFELERVQAPLTLDLANAAALGDRDPPVVRIDDLRASTVHFLDARELSAARLLGALLALRPSQDPEAPATGAGASGAGEAQAGPARP